MTQAAIGSPDRGAIVGARTWRARLSPAVTHQASVGAAQRAARLNPTCFT